MTSQSQPTSGRPPFRRLSAGWVFTALALLVWAWVHADYGITWDETVQSKYGEALRIFFSGGLTFDEFNHFPDLPENIYFYGPTLDLGCAIIAHAFGGDIYAVRHGVLGLMWVAMFYPVCALGRRVAGRAGAWSAGAALLGMPSLFGQAFNNPKDLPLACAAIWLVYAAVVVASARRLGWVHAVKLGAAVGGVLLMRPGAWFLCVLLGLVPLAAFWRSQRVTGRWEVGKLFKPLPILVAAVVIGWVLMVLPWPNAWHSPLGHPIKSAGLAMHFQEVYPVQLAGQVYPSNRLPWNYLVGYLVLTLPLPLLVLAAFGHLVFAKRFFHSVPAAMAVLGTAFLLWFPLATFIVLRPNIYDGMRHFLFMLPAVAVLAGVAMGSLIQHLRGTARTAMVPVGFALMLYATPDMVRLHPYENVYYNFMAGPKATLHERYETDYWVSSYREAAGWINGIQARSDRPLCVAVAANHFSANAFTHFLDPRVKAVDFALDNFSTNQMPAVIDYYVATVRYNQWRNFATAPVAHRVERDGILLSIIRGNPKNQEPEASTSLHR